eukprot:4799223-Lingulodinium_polyedra.AAC.1
MAFLGALDGRVVAHGQGRQAPAPALCRPQAAVGTHRTEEGTSSQAAGHGDRQRGNRIAARPLVRHAALE